MWSGTNQVNEPPNPRFRLHKLREIVTEMKDFFSKDNGFPLEKEPIEIKCSLLFNVKLTQSKIRK